MIKRFLFPCPIPTSLQTAHKSYFSKQKQSARRVQTIGFASNNIEDIKSLSFKASSRLVFEEGRCLVYRSRFSAARTVKDYLWQGSMLSYFAYCLTFQVNFMVDPMVKHLYVAGIGLCILDITQP